MQTDPLFQKAREMFAIAISLFGAYELAPGENEYWMQVNRQSTSPDAMVAVRNKRADGTIELAMIQIEHVEMEEHAGTDDIVEFLLKTKLSPKKGYGKKMMIVCFVNRKVPLNHRDIHERLKKVSPRPTIYVCGRPVNGPMGEFVIFSPWPDPTKPLTYNINETAKKYSLKSPMTFSLGSQDTEIPTGKVVINLYQALGLDEEKIKKKTTSLPPKPSSHHDKL